MLDHFRELLLKKASDDDSLKTLILFTKDDILAGYVIESLMKANHKGVAANPAISSWGGYATSQDVGMLRDAIGHHVSKYKAALQAGDRATANKHVAKAMNLMNFASKAAKHSGGKLKFEHVPTNAWEMNYTGSEKRPDGKYREDQKGLNRKLSHGQGMFPDYQYLEMKPHADYRNTQRIAGYEDKPYPFHEVKINDKHISIDPPSDEKPYTGKYEAHAFDAHPVNKLIDIPHNKIEQRKKSGIDDLKEYHNEASKWHDSPHVGTWMSQQTAAEDDNPSAYAARGLKPSAPAVEQPLAHSLDPIKGRRGSQQ